MEEVEFILFYKETEAKAQANVTQDPDLGERLSSHCPLVRFMVKTNIRLIFLPECSEIALVTYLSFACA